MLKLKRLDTWLGAAGFAVLLASTAVSAGMKEDAEAGFAAHAAGNLMSAIEYLRKAAEAGYAPAQSRLAYILDQAEEDEEAFDWFTRAARQEDPEGAYGLGAMYAKGEGTEKDPVKAGEWIRRAAELGHVPAMRTLASAMEEGKLGFEQDPVQAVYWFGRAADNGDTVAIRRLADAYSKGELGVTADQGKAGRLRQQIEKPFLEP